MKKRTIQVVSFALVLVLMTIALSSCGEDVFGRTWGFNDGGRPIDYYWLETYAECVDAIERMQVHDSTFYETMLVSDESELYDMKYCIKIWSRDIEVKHPYKIFSFEFGAKSFDWKAVNVEIMCFAFFEDVTINEIIYSNTWSYKAYQILPEIEYAKNNNFSYDGVKISSSIFTESRDDYNIYEYSFDDMPILKIKFNKNKNDPLGDDALQDIVNSIDVDIYENMKNNFV